MNTNESFEHTKFVAVRHKPEDKRLFWFIVPEELRDAAQRGRTVICNTRKGRQPGKIEALYEGLRVKPPDLNEWPSKEIVAVQKTFELSKIIIPWDMESSNPDPAKIARRVEEFYKSGRFKTNVMCDPTGVLRDGYTAYLVAKMFSHDYLTAFCVV